MESQSSNQQKKPSQLEALTKDELVQKYTGLRTLALKAKAAHNECQEDNKRLTEKLQQMEAQKAADKECLKAMQEIVDSLTENKLQTATKLQEATDRNEKLMAALKDMQLNQSNTEELAIENEALKRQIKRLTDENEELYADLQNLEQKMEKNNENALEDIQQMASSDQTGDERLSQLVDGLKAQVTALENERKSAEEQHQAAKAENIGLRDKCSNFDRQFKDLLTKSDASTKKMSLYKTKLIEISNKLKALKATKKILLEVVKDYAQTIPKWQKEIMGASNKVFEKLNAYEKENRNLRARIEELQERESIAMAAVDAEIYQKQLEAENNEKMSMKLMDFQSNLEKFKEAERPPSPSLEAPQSDVMELKIFELEKIIAANQQHHEGIKQALISQFDALQATQQQTDDQLRAKIVQLESAEASLAQFKAENKELLDELKEINQVLKERGEVISLQMEKIKQLEKVSVERSEQLAQSVRDKDSEILQMTQELKELREKVQASWNTSMADNQAEVLSTSTISRADEGARLREIEDSFEEKYFKLKSLAVRLKKKNAEQAAQIIKLETATPRKDVMDNVVKSPVSEYAQDNTALKEFQMQVKLEKEAFNLAKKELENELQGLKAALVTKDQEIQKGIDAQNTLRADLDKLRVAAKKTNVLSLEMDAYEKSLNDINAKLKAKKVHCDELEGTIDAQTKSIEALKHQIKLLEDSLEGEKQHSKDQKQQLDLQQSKLRESEHNKAELSHLLEQETTSKERLQLALDDSRIELSKAMADREKLCGSLEAERNKLTKQVFALEDELETIRQTFKAKEQECEDVKTEFASYKIRAQSVLRNQTRETGRDQELEEELTMLRKSAEKTNVKLTAQKNSLEAATKKCEELESDKQRLQNRCKELMELIEEARLQCENLMDENKRQVREHQDALKTQRLQYETLNNCYKSQIKELEDKHVKELENVSRRKVNASVTSDSHPPVSLDEHKINLILMQREEGEGSESSQQPLGTYVTSSAVPLRKASTSSRSSKRDLMPLDELLNTTLPDDSSTFVDSEFSDRPVSPTVELRQTQSQLTVQASRVKHLTSLLAEAEQDLAKLTQLNELLKEEVRRQERSIERSAGLEQHIHNSEYLKNVIFKFLTLNSCDEKIHLVPVLNTILKLSPDEAQKLQSVAKGEGGGGAFGWVAGKIW